MGGRRRCPAAIRSIVLLGYAPRFMFSRMFIVQLTWALKICGH
jgi:hypothetical protein